MKRSSLINGGEVTPAALDEVARFVIVNTQRFGERFASLDGTMRQGGFFCVLDDSGERKLFLAAGHPDPQKLNGYRMNAHNKCLGMLERANDGNCVSSWYFRDHGAHPPQYGGGIKLSGGAFMSFSGFPELVDEAFCIHVARRFGLIDEMREHDIVQTSGNTLMQEVDTWLKEAA